MCIRDSHKDWYSRRFLEEVERFFKLGKRGWIELLIAEEPDGLIQVRASDVVFSGGLRLKLTTTYGPALVPGGINLLYPLRNRVTALGVDAVEQTRIDEVAIVDKWRRLLHQGFSEISALYQQKTARRIRIKVLNIDYGADGTPLWKVLMEGEARRWSSAD